MHQVLVHGAVVILPVARLDGPNKPRAVTKAVRYLLSRYKPRFVAFEAGPDSRQAGTSAPLGLELPLDQEARDLGILTVPVRRAEIGRVLGIGTATDAAVEDRLELERAASQYLAN